MSASIHECSDSIDIEIPTVCQSVCLSVLLFVLHMLALC